MVTSAFPHLGEEDCLRGWNGSGTIFFGHCNLRCVFCQNFDISQGIRPQIRGITPEALGRLMLDLQARGCHNVNFVTPEHVAPQVLEAMVTAVESGLRIPLVYNTSAYDSLESLTLLDGVVDIAARRNEGDPGMDRPRTGPRNVCERHGPVPACRKSRGRKMA